MSEDKEKKKLPDEIAKEEELLAENREKTRADARKAASENEKAPPKPKKEIIAGD